MANELQVTSGLVFNKGYISITRERNHSVTISDAGYSAGTIDLTTNAIQVPIDLATASYIWFANLSTTDTIDIHHSAASEDTYGFVDPIITLAPGQTAQFPPGDGTTTWWAVSQTGTPTLEYFAVAV